MNAQTVEDNGVIKEFSSHLKGNPNVESAFGCWHHVERTPVAAVIYRVLSK